MDQVSTNFSVDHNRLATSVKKNLTQRDNYASAMHQTLNATGKLSLSQT